MSYEVVIEDFDFLTHQLRVQVGEKIIFKLSNQVPFHAEHIIYGRSDNKLLCFESEVLQIQENTSFEYIPQVTGDIFVTCKIYLDMCCEINVRDGDSDDSDDCDNESESSSDKQSEEDESEAEYSLETKQNAEFLHLPPPSRKGKEIPSPIIEGVAHRVIPIIEDRRIHRFMDEDDDESSQHHGELSAHERDSDSFYDSDDVISLDDYDNNSHLFRPSMSDEMKSPIVSLNQADIANIFEHMPLDFINYKDGDEIHPYAINLDKRFQQEDDQDETEEYPLYLSHYDPLTPLSNMYCYPTSVQRILPPLPPLHGTSSSSSSSSSSRVIPVLVNEFSFNPKQVVCSFRDRIKFLLNDQEIRHCTLYCEGEFDSILLDKNYQPYFIYQPSQCGSFIIKNEIYNFVCKVIVHDSNDLSRMNHQIESPPKLFGSFHPNMNNLPKPIFNMASLEQKEIDYSEKNAEYIDPSSAMMPNDYIHPSFTVTYPYEEEEFADVLQDLTYLNVDPDLTLVEDVKPIVFSSSADSTTAVSLATSEDSRDDDVDTDPEASFSGATNSLVLDSSANNTELEKLSRKAKKKKRRKEKQKLQRKMTREASNREDNMMNLDENLTAPENRKLEQDQESLEERIELSPEKDRSDGYMLATADFSEDFEVLSEDSQVDGEQGVKEGGSTSPDKLELNVTSSIMSPIIQRKTNIIISPVDKKAPIDDSIYDENVSFDSDEDNLAAEESKSEPQFTIPDSLVQLSEEESVKSLPALIPKPSTPPCSSKNSEDVSTPAATNTSHHVYTTPTSGKKTIALLSALGLKSKSIEERNPISSFDLLVETSESKGSPQKYHDPNHFQSPLSSVPDDISNISPSLINDEQQREQELQEFLLKRFEVMREKYDHNLPDVLPRGKEVPVYCWSSLPSKEDNQTHDESDSNTKSIENNASKPVIFPSPRQSRQKPKKSSFRGISGVYVPPPARSSSNDDGEKKLRGVSVATNSSSTASPRTSSSHKSKHKT